MKKLIILVFLIALGVNLSAQRFCYVDTDYILENLPEYTQAQKRLKNQTEQWNLEIKNKQEALTKLMAEFETEKVLLTEDQVTKQEDAIALEIKNIKALQEQRFGANGNLVNLRKNLVKPIQDQVWNAVKLVAERRNYSFVFDKGSDLIMIYTDPKFDISRDVLKEINPEALGNTIKSNNNTPRKTNTNNRKTNTNSSNTNSRKIKK